MKSPSNRTSGTLALSALLALVALLVWWRTRPAENTAAWSGDSPASVPAANPAPVAAVVTTAQRQPDQIDGRPALLGEQILVGYARADAPPEHDLTLMARLMDNFTLLVKDAADRPLSANEDWASALRGVNSASERFLSDQHVALNPQGRLVDRWGTPLHFHSLGDRRHEVRSAGPDGKLWTEDDIHRNADGSFRRGTNLLSGDLLDTAIDRERR